MHQTTRIVITPNKKQTTPVRFCASSLSFAAIAANGIAASSAASISLRITAHPIAP